jgi:D-alanyl-lipoteichoic acid acyltransferase DltB (MBOAT superfamily)
MLFPTTDFAIFLCVTFVANWLLMPLRTPWKLFMIAASYVFYAWWDPSLVWLLALVSVLAQIGAIAVARAEAGAARRWAVGSSVVLVLLPLLWFKYYGFVSVTAANVLDSVGVSSPLPLLQVVLPVGISFYTFMAISYVVDVYRRDTEPAGWIDLFLYLSFFPHLVAGPIVRAKELIPQFAEARDPERIDVPHAAWLIFRGLFKKMVISSFLAAEIVDPVFADATGFSSLDVLLAIYGYAIVIYADFSGYTDIAIGVAELLGFRFPQNFDRPYAARSLQDFWRRWHITLSRWLRDYLYIPLGGSRSGSPQVYFNIMLTMLLGGLWHGAGWTFIAWGGIHGAGQVVGHFRRRRRLAAGRPELGESLVARVRQRVVTFHVVCLGWVFFRATSFDEAFEVLGRLGSGIDARSVVASGLVAAVIASAIAVQNAAPLAARLGLERFKERAADVPAVALGAALAVCLFLITTLSPEGVAPFIYFRF